MMTSRNTAAGRHSARPLPRATTSLLNAPPDSKRGLADQVAGAELGDGRAAAQDEELAGEHDVEPVGPLAGAEHDGAGVDLEELELGGELDALGVVERPEQRAGPHPAIDQAIADEPEHGAQHVAVVGEHARQGVAIDAQELGGRQADHGGGARLVGHQRDLAEEGARAQPGQLGAPADAALDRQLALDDDVQRVARIAGVEQSLAALERHQLEVGDQGLERVARHAGEQRGGGERARRGGADHARLRQRDLLQIGEIELGRLGDLGVTDSSGASIPASIPASISQIGSDGGIGWRWVLCVVSCSNSSSSIGMTWMPGSSPSRGWDAGTSVLRSTVSSAAPSGRAIGRLLLRPSAMFGGVDGRVRR